MTAVTPEKHLYLARFFYADDDKIPATRLYHAPDASFVADKLRQNVPNPKRITVYALKPVLTCEE